MKFFKTPAAFREWFERNAAKKQELLVGFYKRHTGKPSITWEESVLEALCFGWIDGVRRSVDADRYTIRFTPRKPTSTWSAINIRHVKRLESEGRMTDAGRRAYEARADHKSAIYAYEQRQAGLPAAYEKRLEKHAKAWAYWQSEAPWYRRNAGYWVASAKREETRDKRFAELVARSASGLRIKHLVPRKSR
ncbi:MAG TPA: YdeI/OmpD-associated family protein [Kofleriaceae bacterium]|nr:YdeI/OmpD-associated family protein [Kofleriaceae bacterium]